MKIKKKIILILFSVLMIPASSGMDGKEESFDMKRELSSIMGYRYESVGDVEMLDTGRIISRKTVDKKNRHESVTISGKRKDRKYASGNGTSDIHSDVEYADEDHISYIVTDSQRIDFSYDPDMHLTDVFLNDVRLFHRDEDDNSLVIGYANGDRSEFVRTGDSATYRDSLSEVTYVLDSSTEEPIKSISQGKNTLYGYDTDGSIAYTENAFGYVRKEKNTISQSLFGLKGSTAYEGEDMTFVTDGVKDSISVSHDGAEETRLLNGKLLYKYDDSRMDDGIRTYSSPFGDMTCVYSKEGRLLEKHEEGKDSFYGYDGLGRLIHEQSGETCVDYGYDSSGNLLEVSGNERHSLSYLNGEDNNQLSVSDGEELRYDAYGNLTSYGEAEFFWNGGRMTGYRDGNTEVRYSYSPEGTRLSKDSDTEGHTDYFHFDGRLVGSRSDRCGMVNYLYSESGTPTGLTYKGVSYFYVHDPSGNIRGIVDGNAVPVLSYSYSSWGIPSVDYCLVGGLDIANEILFKDYVYDRETGLYHLCSRYYSPCLMRFLSRDDLERISTNGLNDPCYNLYSYAMDDPISMADVDGHMAAAAAAAVTQMLVGICILVATYCYFITIYNYYLNHSSMGSLGYTAVRRSKWDFYDLMKRLKEALKQSKFEFMVTAICFWGKRIGRNNEDHHIIAQNDSRADDARKIWIGEQYCHRLINDALNIVSLKYMFHKHLHTNSYFFAVNVLIQAGWDSKQTGVETNLSMIKTALLTINRNLTF